MSYSTGQSQFGQGNMWAMIKSLLRGEGGINPADQVGLGALQVAKATYDFSVDGGAVGVISPKSSPIIPLGAIVLGGIVDPIITPVGGAGATISIGIGAGNSIKAAALFSTYVGGTPLAVIPIWSGGFFKVNPAGKINFEVLVNPLSAGKIACQIVYVMGGE